jgi:endonuclease YncB( thermonuclease family)
MLILKHLVNPVQVTYLLAMFVNSLHRLISIIAAATLMFGCVAEPTSVSPGTPVPATPQRRSTNASTLVGTVVKVIDGDTFDMIDGGRRTYRIRLQGIDAPERNQAFGNASTRSLASLVKGRQVVVEWIKIDEYKRRVGKVLVDRQDVCLEQIRSGMAWHFKRYQFEQSDEERELYARLEIQARAARKGLWADAAPVEPWVIRDRQRSASFPISEPTSADPVVAAVAQEGTIRGNRRSMIYHWPGCPNYDDIAMHNRVSFNTRAEAEQAGFRAARNCH